MSINDLGFEPVSVNDPAVWNASTLKSKYDVLLNLSETDLQCIEHQLDKSAHKSIYDLTERFRCACNPAAGKQLI